MTIVAAADGSALGNPGPAGWAWYVDANCWRAGGWPHGTNNMGELMAVLDLFLSTAHVKDEPLHILCDSQYVINSVTKWMLGWKRKGWRKSDGKPVLNMDLLKQIDAAIVGRKYTFEWVKGHAGHPLNEAADDRARDAATAFQAKRAPNEGPGFAGAGQNKISEADISSPTPEAAVEQTRLPAAQPFLQTAESSTQPADSFLQPAEASAQPAEALQLDLFSSLEDEADPAYTPADDSLNILLTLERQLLDPEVRADVVKLGMFLHRDFSEIGVSGRVWTREDSLAALGEEEPSNATLEVLSLNNVDVDTALLSYRSVERRGNVLRSSLWHRENGRWQLRFHQGTLEP